MSETSCFQPEMPSAHLPNLDELVSDAQLLQTDTIARGNPEFFVGQDDARQALLAFLTDAPEGAVATIQAPFGAGKTTLFYNVLGSLREAGELDRALCHFAVTAAPIKDGQEPSLSDLAYWDKGAFETDLARHQKLPIVGIEEFGRSSAEEVTRVAQAIRDLRDRGQIGRLVLIGEETLEDPDFLAALGVMPTEITKIELEHLSPEDFLESIRVRLNSAGLLRRINAKLMGRFMASPQTLRDVADELEDEGDQYSPENLAHLFDPEFIRLLTYPSQPAGFEYRQARQTIYELLQHRVSPWHVDETAAPVIDGAAYVELYRSRQRILSPETLPTVEAALRTDVLSWLQQYVRKAMDDGEPIRALTIKDILKGVLGSTYDFENSQALAISLRRSCLLKHIEGNYLRAVNTTDLSESSEASSPSRPLTDGVSFIPLPELLLSAAYDPTAPRKTTIDTSFVVRGSDQREKADHLLGSYLRGTINPATYRHHWNNLVRNA